MGSDDGGSWTPGRRHSTRVPAADLESAQTLSEPGRGHDPRCDADDVLGQYPVEEVHAWYRRLVAATRSRATIASPLSPLFLDHYTRASGFRQAGRPLQWDAPDHLRSHEKIAEATRYHREVYLSRERARVGSSHVIAGVRPRWQNPSRYGLRPGLPDAFEMHYESLVDFAPTVLDIVRIQFSGSEAERDLVASLRGFQFRSEVRVRVVHEARRERLAVTFDAFRLIAKDLYDFNFREHLTMPNPDFEHSGANRICPQRREIRVEHRNALRMELAGLASAYEHESRPWQAGQEYRGIGYVEV